MAKDLKSFIKIKRGKEKYRDVKKRVNDFFDVALAREKEESIQQASRCMDCGTPFCHFACPLGNYVPEWNDLLSRGLIENALRLLLASNNLPEVTCRLCPALCEYACVLGINNEAVTIRENELEIIEYGFKHGLIKPNIPAKRTGRKVAIIGSGPAGLSAAMQLNKSGHNVTVFEKDEKAGGILRYGIPDFKLEKLVIDRRVDLMKKEGIEFITSTCVGKDYPADKLLKNFDSVCISIGSRVPRDLAIPGRETGGIYFAMDYLAQSNCRVSGVKIPKDSLIDARGKKVVVIGGGDTGSDCVGTANRQKAASITQIEIMPRPPENRPDEQPWPKYPIILKTTSSHKEGVVREWGILTKEFISEGGKLKKISCVRVDMQRDSRGMPSFKEITKSEFVIEADMAFLALGFLHPQKQGLVEELRLEVDTRGNIKTDDNYMTNVKGIFTAGDSHRGQSLIVWAISEGRRAAHCIDKYLMGKSDLPFI